MSTGHPDCVPLGQPVLATTAYDAPTCLGMDRVLVCTSVRAVQPDIDPCMCLFVMLFSYFPSFLACLSTFLGMSPVDRPLSRH